MKDDLLKRVQKTAMEVLFMFSDFCEENGIEYSISYGTAIGAVRHKGFIPWDDDVDVCLSRTEYEKFLNKRDEKHPTGYFLEKEGPDTDSQINHAKIRKDGTVLASQAEANDGRHHGVWIDLFALDKLPRNKRKRRRMLFYAKLRIVYTRRYAYSGHGKILELVSKLMLSVPKWLQKKILSKTEAEVTKYKNMQDDYELICLAAPEELNFVFPQNMMDEYCNIMFGGKMLRIIKNYDEILRQYYGDYMQYPPEEERVCKHNPEIVVL